MLVPKSKIILAFPGMGKTPLAQLIPGYVDADFGNYRTLMGVPKEEEKKLLEPFAQFIASIEAKCIMTNEPKLADYVKISHIYLPARLSYSAKKMNTTVEQINDWINGWVKIGREHDIPITFVSIGLDYYFAMKLKRCEQIRDYYR